MLSLREFREPTRLISDLLPWAALIGPGLIWQKDGLLQKTFEYRGADLIACSEESITAAHAQLNRALMRLGSGWAIFAEAQRRQRTDYHVGMWQHPAAAIADLERAHYFAQNPHYDSRYFLTFVWQPPSQTRGHLESFFFETVGESLPGASAREVQALKRDVQAFERQVREVTGLIASALPELTELSDDETLSYLKSTISEGVQSVRTPNPPMYLDAYLASEAFMPGDPPMLGPNYVQTCTISEFPESTAPAMLDTLNYLQLEYRWVTRFLALDKTQAAPLIEQYRKRWTQLRKGILTMLKENATGEESRIYNESADDKADNAGAALRALESDSVAFGYGTTSVTVSDPDPRVARKKLHLVKQAIQSQGFVARDETLNARDAWLGTLPGHVYANVRRPIITTANLSHMIPSSALWAGRQRNEHLGKISGVSSPHLICTTTGAGRFACNLNEGDVGHTVVIGPTGSGKSTLLGTLGLQWLRYPGAQVIVFDRDRSARAATLAVGGKVYEPGISRAAFQPLARLDTEEDVLWAREWVGALFSAQALPLTAELQEALGKAVASLRQLPREHRTITNLAHTLRSFSREYALALAPYCAGGQYGSIFDAAEDGVDIRSWTMFEMGPLMDMGEAAVIPALLYLFRRVESQLTGTPTLLVLDEAWLFLRHPVFAKKLGDWLMTLRKRNVFVVFATQQLSHAAANPALLATLLSACPTKIFLSDPTASSAGSAHYYAAFGLSPEEIETIAALTPKRDYYLRAPSGRRAISLGLGPAQLALVGMSSPADQAFLDRMVAERPVEEYAQAMLERRGVTWAADELKRLRGAA